ncbi:hypothetical protein SHIRM173S_07260 [Streptomyces hirsutus]
MTTLPPVGHSSSGSSSAWARKTFALRLRSRARCQRSRVVSEAASLSLTPTSLTNVFRGTPLDATARTILVDEAAQVTSAVTSVCWASPRLSASAGSRSLSRSTAMTYAPSSAKARAVAAPIPAAAPVHHDALPSNRIFSRSTASTPSVTVIRTSV